MEHLVAHVAQEEEHGEKVALWRVHAARMAEQHTAEDSAAAASITFAALFRWINTVRDALEQPIGHDASGPAAPIRSRVLTVGIACPPCSVEETALVLAVARETNWVYVPIDVTLSVAQQVGMLQDAQVDALVTVPEASIAAFLTENPQLLADGDDSSSPQRWIASDAARFFRTLRVFRLGKKHSAPLSTPLVSHFGDEGAAVEAARPLYIMYTSGSTGHPKGVIGTRIGALNRLQWMWQQHPFDDTECERVVRVTKLTFVDSVWEILGALLKHIPLVHLQHQQQEKQKENKNVLPGHVILDDSELFLQTIRRFKVSRCTIVPSILELLLLKYASSTQRSKLHCALASVQYLLVSGEVLPVHLVVQATEALPHVKLLNLYGSTEVSGDVTWFEIQAPLSDIDATLWTQHGVPIGKVHQVVGKTKLLLVNGVERFDISGASNTTTTGSTKPAAKQQVQGELYVAGHPLALGYTTQNAHRQGDGEVDGSMGKWIAIADAEEQDHRSKKTRWFRMGDICKVMGDALYFCGRTDKLVKIRGQRIQLEAVERMIAAALEEEMDHDAQIAQVVALAMKDPSIYALSSPCLVVFLIFDDNDEEHAQAEETTATVYQRKDVLLQSIKDKYGDVYVPRDIVRVPISALRRFPNGKMDKAALQTLYEKIATTATTKSPELNSTQDLDNAAEVPSHIECFVQMQVSKLLNLSPSTATNECSRVGEKRTFQEQGGNSLLATLLSWELQQKFDCAIRPHEMLSSTLDEIVDKLKCAAPLDVSRHEEGGDNPSSSDLVGNEAAATATSTGNAPSQMKKRPRYVLHPRSPADPEGSSVGRLFFESRTRLNQCSAGNGTATCIPQTAISPSPSSSLPNVQLAWRIDLGKCIDASPLIIRRSGASDENVASTWAVIGSHSSRLVCVNVEKQGRIVWQTQLDDRIEASASMSIRDQLVFVGTYNGSLYALDVETGQEKWKFQAKDAIKAAVLVVDEYQLVICGAYDHRVYGIDSVNGVKQWEIDARGSVFSTPVFLKAASQLIFASTSGYLCCAALHKDPPFVETTLWERQLPAPIFSSLNVHPALNLLFVGCADGNMYALDAANGGTRWTVPTQKPIFSSPNVYNDADAMAVVFGSHDGFLRKVSCESGRLMWATKLGNPIFGSPALFQLAPVAAAATRTSKDDAEDSIAKRARRTIVCVPTIDGTLHFCDEASGSILIQKSSNDDGDGDGKSDLGELFSSPVVVDNMCLIGSRSNQLYAFRTTRFG